VSILIKLAISSAVPHTKNPEPRKFISFYPDDLLLTHNEPVEPLRAHSLSHSTPKLNGCQTPSCLLFDSKQSD
jgi:hypothetical protein